MLIKNIYKLDNTEKKGGYQTQKFTASDLSLVSISSSGRFAKHLCNKKNTRQI